MSMLTKEHASIKDLVVSNPKILGGERVIRGTRVPVSLVFNLLSQHYTLEIIQEEYPQLSTKKLELLLKLIASQFDAPTKKKKAKV